MLPYPNPHHFSQEPFYGHIQELINPPILPPPPPFSSAVVLPPPTLYYDHHQIPFPTQNFASETLEALLHPKVISTAVTETTTSPTALPSPISNSNNARTRKRPYRTDRHSKIQTAQGVRDRRMRLSLDVAREFFALQDQLGFDKASQTVDWLLTQSKPAIERLNGSPKHEYNNNSVQNCSDVISMSSTSECGDLAVVSGNKAKGEQSYQAVASYSFNQMMASKDAREKARARARERTVEKMMRRNDDGMMVSANSELDHLVAVALDKPLEGNGMSNIGVYYRHGDQMLNNFEEYEADENEGDFFDGMQF